MVEYIWKSGDREEPLRLISANDLNLVLDEWERIGDYNLPIRAVRKMIDKVPTVDAAPVKHGYWERVANTGIGGTGRCSACGDAIYGYRAFKFCPNCGAMMDLE